jgi:hypothetical protein
VTLPDLVAKLLVEEVADLHGRGALGALVEVPQLQADSAVAALAVTVAEGANLRVAFLLEGGDVAAAAAGLGEDVFDTSVERAEKWRNERGLMATIVVVALGNEARLSSLREFEQVTPATLKRRLATTAEVEFGAVNDVQAEWWRLLGDDTLISLTQLADYYLALHGKPEQEIVDRSTKELQRIGLLPDPELLNKRALIGRRLAMNREVLQRLQVLSEPDRKLIQKNVANEADIEARAELQAGLRRVGQLRRGQGAPSLGEAQRLLGLRKKLNSGDDKPKSGDGTPNGQGGKAVGVAGAAAEAVVAGNDELLDQVLHQLEAHLEKIDESALKLERIVVSGPAPEGKSAEDLQVQGRVDLVNLMARMASETAFGGLLRVAGDGIDEMIRRLAGESKTEETWTLDQTQEILGASDHEAVKEVRDRLAAYRQARADVLPRLRSLAVAPLLVAGAPEARGKLLALVERYQELLVAIDKRHPTLLEQFGSDTDTLIGELLKLDVVVLDADGRTMALLTPVHPLYVWHFAEFCRTVDEQRERLLERDHRLIADVAAEDLPNFLSSLSLPPVTGPSTSVLPFVGRLGPLPYFASVSERNENPDGADAARTLVKAYLEVFPPAADGLRVAVLDAPDPSPYLLMINDLADEGIVTGAHLLALRHPRDKIGTDLRLDADEEDRVAQRFRATGAERRFTFDVQDVPASKMLPADMATAHVLIAVDQTDGKPRRLPEVDQPLQPLVAARKLQFRTVGNRVELEAAHGGPFASYFKMAKHIGSMLGASDWDRHQSEELTRQLKDAARHAHWFVLADRRIDRDLDLDLLRIYTGREGDRDVAAFARYPDPFRRALRDVASQYNTAINEHQLDELLDELTQLLDAGVLWLRTTADGIVNHNVVKGVLGTLIASRWWRAAPPDGHRRMVISLDDPAARKWLHLGDDPRRADLLGLDLGPDALEVAAIEIKAVEASNVEYQVQDGKVGGEAVGQILSTRTLLLDVFGQGPGADLITTPARRELLRANAFRELSKGRYDGDERRDWVKAIEDALTMQTTVDVTAHLVDVRIGAHPDTLSHPITALADDGTPVTITVLNEREVEELSPSKPAKVTSERDEAVPSTASARATQDGDDDGESLSMSTVLDTVTGGDPDMRPARGDGTPERLSSGQAGRSTDDDFLQAANSRPVAYLGTGDAAYGQREELYFDPEKPGAELPNSHVSITGETGSGKTQATKALLRDLAHGYGLPTLILDFKDDYSSPDYAATEGLTIQDASFGGLPFNPLEPAIDPTSQRVNPMAHIHQVGEILKRVYRLGDQQAFHLREAIKKAYEDRGLRVASHVASDGACWPSLDDVRSILANGGQEPLLGRLSPIFDLGLFSEPGDANLRDLLDGQVVIRLSQLPGDQVKNAVAEFLLLALYNHLIRQEQPRRLSRLLVLDEAWRVTKSERLEPLMRESRAFGLGIVIATQYPNDLSDPVAGATATRLFFSQSLSDPIKAIQSTLVGRSTGNEAERVATEVRSMSKFHCLLQNSQHRPYRRVTVKPYWQRSQ